MLVFLCEGYRSIPYFMFTATAWPRRQTMGFSDPRFDPVTKRCTRPIQEVLFTSIVAGLFAEGRMPNGSIFDVGANRGIWACYWASVAPDRIVHAMDPDPRYVKIMKAHYNHVANLRPMLGALGSESKETDHGTAASGGMNFFPLSGEAKQGSLRVYKLDELFDSWREERLAFAQFDVDGYEVPPTVGFERAQWAALGMLQLTRGFFRTHDSSSCCKAPVRSSRATVRSSRPSCTSRSLQRRATTCCASSSRSVMRRTSSRRWRAIGTTRRVGYASVTHESTRLLLMTAAPSAREQHRAACMWLACPSGL